MKILTKAPRGTQDILPSQVYKWQFVEKIIMEISTLFGFKEIRFPTFEHTELFQRSVGDTTDVVQKEMFTFQDRGGRSLSLKPEGTAGTVRAAIESGLINDALPLKLSYVTPCFRNERPQAGRFKEFHQFGVEMFGPQSPVADVEVISLANEIFEMIGIKNIELQINSIGCNQCRSDYQNELKKYFTDNIKHLCETCKRRIGTNPMRVLDCKAEDCAKIASKAPVVLDYICDDCKTNFNQVKQSLDAAGINYTVNPKIVRGLDYYNRTVFEFVSSELGAQSTVCGGGRYDGLVEVLGGKPTPALGFAMGLERLIIIMEKQGIEIPKLKQCDLYIASIGEKATLKAVELTSELRKEGFYVECDTMSRSLKAQMKYADKIGALTSFVIGDNELEQGKVTLKDMQTGETTSVELDKIKDAIYDKRLIDVAEAIENPHFSMNSFLN